MEPKTFTAPGPQGLEPSIDGTPYLSKGGTFPL